jgi:hypothetical protein
MKSYMHFFAHLDHNLLIFIRGGNTVNTLHVQGLLVNDINTKAMRSGSAVQIFLATTQTFTKDMALSKHGRDTVQFV